MYNELLTAIEHSDLLKARASLDSLLKNRQIEPWAVHEVLFPVIHRVLNPPFINPHLPKMYAIHRELVSYLDPKDTALLLRVEVEEYTRREKLPLIDRPTSFPIVTDFEEMEAAISRKDVTGTAITMAAYLKVAGPELLTKKLLLLASGFLDHSLGHSLSCTAFILMEMINKINEDSWPVLVLLADYFCKGRFRQTPKLEYSAISDYKEVYLTELRKAISGTGVVALHHTITLYSIERSRHLFEPFEYDHLLTMWTKMLGSKEEELHPIEKFGIEILPDFSGFFAVFLKYDPQQVLGMVKSALRSEKDRKRLGGFLIRGVLQCYNGRYDPHYLTGLGAAIWIIEEYHDQPVIVMNGLHQYLDYFFTGMKRDV